MKVAIIIFEINKSNWYAKFAELAAFLIAWGAAALNLWKFWEISE